MSDAEKTDRVEKALRELNAAFIDATIHAQDAFALVAYVKALESKIAALESASKDAIRREALEEAAALVTLPRNMSYFWGEVSGARHFADQIADQIRALSQKAGE